MSLRSNARRAGPKMPDYTRTSTQALNLDNYVPAYLTYLAGKISNSASATYRPKFGVGITDWRIMACSPQSRGYPPGAFATSSALIRRRQSQRARDEIKRFRRCALGR